MSNLGSILTTYARTAAGDDRELERGLVELIAMAIARASVVTESPSMCRRTDGIIGALVTVLSCTLAPAPDRTRPAAQRDRAHQQNTQRQIAAADTGPFCGRFVPPNFPKLSISKSRSHGKRHLFPSTPRSHQPQARSRNRCAQQRELDVQKILVLTRERGVTLHKLIRPHRIIWMLSNGNFVPDEIALALLESGFVIGGGDSLVGGLEMSQTFRYVET
jgi:hypothetical protein